MQGGADALHVARVCLLRDSCYWRVLPCSCARLVRSSVDRSRMAHFGEGLRCADGRARS